MLPVFECTEAAKGNMSASRRMSGARAEEDEFPLFDFVGSCRQK